MQATATVLYFPKQSMSASKKHPKEKCTVLEWIRGGLVFPGKIAPPDKPQPKPGKSGAR